MKLPQKENIRTDNPEDCLPRYYQPFLKHFYIRRLKMASGFLRLEAPYENLLEVGYGSGIFFHELSKICKNLHGLEIFAPAKEQTEKMMQKEDLRAELAIGSVTQMPYPDNFFDAIVCVSALEHLAPQEMERAMAEIKRAAKNNANIVLGFPSGRKLMQAYCMLVRRNLQFDLHRSGHELIMKTLKNNFEVQKIKKLFRFLPIYYVVKCKKIL